MTNKLSAAVLLVFALAIWNLGAAIGTAQMPPGMIIAFAGANCPAGMIPADNTSLVRTGKYAALFSAIGTANGSADSTHFNVPDLRGRFMRGVDGTAGNDPDKIGRSAVTGGNAGNLVGSIESDQYASHTHGVTDPGHSHAAPNPGGGFLANGTFGRTSASLSLSGSGYEIATGTTTDITHITIQSSGGSETRPKNVYVLYCIKY